MFSISFYSLYGLIPCFAPLPRAHPFAHLPVFPRYLDVAAWPRLVASAFGEELALLVGVGMLLASAGAAQSVLVFKLRLDGEEFPGTIHALEVAASTLVFVELRALEFQVAAKAAF